jgi:polar amino acid transport system permease protein
MYHFDFAVLLDYIPQLLNGLKWTFVISLLAVIGGTVLGMAGALARISHNKALNVLAAIYVEWIRNTPLLVQILFLYFGIGVFIKFSALVATIISLSVFSGAYITEIFRAGIQSVHKGQREAALSLGMTEAMSLRLVIMPQAFKRVLPPLAGQFISLIKDSSLVSVIAVEELTYAARNVITMTFRAFEVYIAVAVFYFCLSFLLSRSVRLLEERMARSD